MQHTLYASWHSPLHWKRNIHGSSCFLTLKNLWCSNTLLRNRRVGYFAETVGCDTASTGIVQDSTIGRACACSVSRGRLKGGRHCASISWCRNGYVSTRWQISLIFFWRSWRRWLNHRPGSIFIADALLMVVFDGASTCEFSIHATTKKNRKHHHLNTYSLMRKVILLVAYQQAWVEPTATFWTIVVITLGACTLIRTAFRILDLRVAGLDAFRPFFNQIPVTLRTIGTC
jgi:hypothetical protein